LREGRWIEVNETDIVAKNLPLGRILEKERYENIPNKNRIIGRDSGSRINLDLSTNH